MNPELPQAQPSAESLLPTSGGAEVTLGDGVEREGSGVERPAPAAIEAPTPHPSLPIIVQDTATVAAPVSPVSPQPTVGSTPAIAGDDDLIEKEWVDKLKRIISLTRDDPYERARVIAQLQADYLKKRYNREIGRSNG